MALLSSSVGGMAYQQRCSVFEHLDGLLSGYGGEVIQEVDSASETASQ